MNINDLKGSYKIQSAPQQPTTTGSSPMNISQLGGNYTTQPSAQPTLPNTISGQSGISNTLGDFSSGFAKGALNTARDTAGLLQTGGKAILGAFGVNTQGMGINAIDNSTPEGAGVNSILQPKSQAEKVGGYAETATELATPFLSLEGEKVIKAGQKGYEAYQATQKAKQVAADTSKITEMISPKATAKEAKLAQTQGRLIEGKKPTLFRAGTEDTITPSKKTLSATETITQNIPNASKMSPTELYNAVDNNIKETATKLRPEMEATPIKPETIDKINSDWETLKKTQMADAPATEEANVTKRQAKFESLLKKSGNKSHADLWDTAIAYDDSVSDAVKKANSLSSESQQLQKQEWLDNRKILSDAIEKSSKPEFKQMSDMYEAKNGLTSKAKVNEAGMSKFNQYLKDNPGTAKLLGGATAYEVLKHLGVPLP